MKKFYSLLFTFFLLQTMLMATEQKVVYDLTTGDAKKIESNLLRSLKAVSNYYTEKKIDYKMAVVISGDAYKYFVDNLKFSHYDKDTSLISLQPKIASKLKELAEVYHVKFLMCNVGMKARAIPEDSLYNFVEAEKMKSVYLIEFQNEG